jgi:hypothetical protein
VKTPFLEKTFDVHLKAKKNDLDVMMAIQNKSVLKGHFHLDKKDNLVPHHQLDHRL